MTSAHRRPEDQDCGECVHHRLRHDLPDGLCGEVINDVWGDPVSCDCIEFEEDEMPKKTLREWWAGEPSLRRHPLRWAVWLLDEGLDRIPTREDGRWFRRSGLGCRLALHRFWWVES